MILSDIQIRGARLRGNIVIEPFDEESLGPNSYDVRLGRTLICYWLKPLESEPSASIGAKPRARVGLDCKEKPEIYEIEIPATGFILEPDQLYLGSTIEYTETHGLVPYLDGKSSVGRLGIDVHCTAGRGDNGFCGYWTMEIKVVVPVRIYAGMPIGQLTYHDTVAATVNYSERKSSKYNNHDPRPQPSRMYKNFSLKERP